MLATLKDEKARIGGWQTHLSKAPIFAPSSGPYSDFSCPRSQKNMSGAKHIRGFLHAAVSLCGPGQSPFHWHCGDCACLGFQCASDSSVQTGQENGLSTFFLCDHFHIIRFFNTCGTRQTASTWTGEPGMWDQWLWQSLSCRNPMAYGAMLVLQVADCRGSFLRHLSSGKKRPVLRSKLKCFATGPGGFEPWSLKRPWTDLQSLTWATGPMPMWTQDRGGSCRFVAEYARIANHALQITLSQKGKGKWNRSTAHACSRAGFRLESASSRQKASTAALMEEGQRMLEGFGLSLPQPSWTGKIMGWL